MQSILCRPDYSFVPAKGLLGNEHFQVCYCTNDIEQACKIFGDRFGISKFTRLAGPTPGGGHIHVELAWSGNTMFELITCDGPKSELFNARLPKTEFAMHLHHLGFLVSSLSAWDALFEEITRCGREVVQQNNNEGFMRHCFIYIEELGHYFEYIYPEKAGLDFFANVVRN